MKSFFTFAYVVLPNYDFVVFVNLAFFTHKTMALGPSYNILY